MPKCSVENCKNHNSVRLKKDGVTYHRFPQNYELREKWRKFVAIGRNDKYYKPNQSSIICSCHFSESDMYLTKKGFIRLKKSAIPQLKNDDITDISTLTQSEQKRADTCTEAESFAQIKPCNSEQAEGQTQRSELSVEMDLKSTFLQPIKQEVSELASSSSLTSCSSVLDSPKTSHIKYQLKKCHKRIIMKNRQIRNLKKQNRRLLRSNFTLKELIKNLKKKDE